MKNGIQCVLACPVCAPVIYNRPVGRWKESLAIAVHQFANLQAEINLIKHKHGLGSGSGLNRTVRSITSVLALTPILSLGATSAAHTSRSIICFLSFVPSSLSFSGRPSSREVWRRGAACCSASSTSLRPGLTTSRASPRRGLAVGCVWASNAAPTWQPWTSTATPTPTSKRKDEIKHLVYNT